MYTSYFEKVKQASRSLSSLSDEKITQILKSLSKELCCKQELILAANAEDLKRMAHDDPKYDRLKLNQSRLKTIAEDLINVAQLPSSIGEILEKRTMPNQLQIEKKRVALGVVGVIYEARPNVTIDVFALCLKSGNACVLKGGSDAANSNKTLVKIIHEVLDKHNLDPDIVQLLPNDRRASDELMSATAYVDVLIPRGSQALINTVRDKSKLPVIETGAGIVHTYFDETGDVEMGQKIICNAKTRRVSVCNALDCLIIHQSRLRDLPALIQPMANKQVAVYADKLAFDQLNGQYPDQLLREATAEDFGSEFLSHKMSIKTAESIDSALNHIFQHSSKHSEAIITQDTEAAERFLNEVDAAAVYLNTSTAFTDGGQFGLGAEIGISTQKLHARGPMGLKELSSYKWIIKGDGQIRPS